MRDALLRPLDLTRIRAIVKEHGALIGAPDAHLFGSPQGDGSPYVVVADAYRFIVEERGVELERRETDDLDELLYWIFDGITFALASDFERRNRRPDEDPRRLLFATQDEALGRISARWRERKRIERQPILIRSPFDDDRGSPDDPDVPPDAALALVSGVAGRPRHVRAVSRPRPLMRYLAKLIWWALATGAIWLIYDHARAIIASDVPRAIAAMLLVIVGSVLVAMVHAAVMGHLRARGG